MVRILNKTNYKGQQIVSIEDKIGQQFAIVLGYKKLFASIADAKRHINGKPTIYDIEVDRLTMERCKQLERVYEIASHRYMTIDKGISASNIGYIIAYDGQEYIADITIRKDLDYRTECAIFKAVDRQITFDNAIPLYKKMDVDYSIEALEKCIDEFIDQLENKSND